MGVIGKCNYCTLKWLQQRAKSTYQEITVKAAPEGGVDVYRHKIGQTPTDEDWVAWFMDLTTECRC